MAAPTREGIVGLLAPVVERAGLDLEDVDVTPAGKRRMVRVVVDGDGGVDLDLVASVSHDVSEALDDADVMGETPYVLEVTSPGVDRPLTAPRHWRRARTRLVEVTPRQAPVVVGRVVDADEDPDGGVTLDIEGSERVLRYEDIARAKVQVEFSRSATRPPPIPARTRGSDVVNIDMAALRALEREKEIPFDVVVEAIESALLTAYRHTEGARAARPRRASTARPASSRCWRAGDRRRRQRAARVGRHPGGLRPDRRDDRPAGDPAAAARRRGRGALRRVRPAARATWSSGVMRAQRPRPGRAMVSVDLGELEGVLPAASRCPARRYEHGERMRVLRRRGSRKGCAGRRSRCRAPTRAWCKQAVRARGARDRRRLGRDRRDRPRGRPPHQDRRHAPPMPGRQRQGRLHRPDGPAGPRRDERAARREDRHHRLVGGPGRRSSATRCRRPRSLSVEVVDEADAGGPGDRAGLPALAGDRPGGAERPAGGPADRLAHRHPLRHASRPTPTPPRRGASVGEPTRRSGRVVCGRRADSACPDASVEQTARRPSRYRCAPAWVAGDVRRPAELLRVVAVGGEAGHGRRPDPRAGCRGGVRGCTPIPACLDARGSAPGVRRGRCGSPGPLDLTARVRESTSHAPTTCVRQHRRARSQAGRRRR